jgi:hypothetical protein
VVAAVVAVPVSEPQEAIQLSARRQQGAQRQIRRTLIPLARQELRPEAQSIFQERGAMLQRLRLILQYMGQAATGQDHTLVMDRAMFTQPPVAMQLSQERAVVVGT